MHAAIRSYLCHQIWFSIVLTVHDSDNLHEGAAVKGLSFNSASQLLILSSTDNFCNQFGPRSGQTQCLAWSGFKPFDTLIVFLKEFFWKKSQQTTKYFKPGTESHDYFADPQNIDQNSMYRSNSCHKLVMYWYPLCLGTTLLGIVSLHKNR